MGPHMKTREFRRLTLWVDHDRPTLSTLTDEQKVDYFRRRTSLVVLAPLAALLATLRPKNKSSSPVLCFGTCACCAIEAFGRFQLGLSGSGYGRTCFDAFVGKFMHKDFGRRLHGEKYVDLLRDNFRNGLAHGLAIKWGGFHASKTAYFQTMTVGGTVQLEIDPEHFLGDLRQAVRAFVVTLTPGTTEFQDFETAFDKIWVQGL